MSVSALPLAAFQSWMQAVLVHPDGAEAALASPEARRFVAPEEASGVVRERAGLDAAERLQIYASMYPLRMRDPLRADFPALAALLGERRFEKLVGDYVRVYPSKSFTLARLGERLPEFVAGWRSPRRRALLADVAILERAAAQVFDAEEPARLDAAVLRGFPAAAWPHVRLRPADSFRLARVRPGAVDVLDAFLEDLPLPERTGRGRVDVVFYRKDFVVRRRTLGPFEGRFLRALAAGEALGAALAIASRLPGRRPSTGEIAELVPEWIRLGLFARVETAALPDR